MDLLTYCESFAPNAERGYERGDEGYDMNEAREAYMARVEADGCRVVLPCECQLQIDIDSADHYEVFLQSARVVLRNWDCATDITIEDRPSRSGLPRRHITLTLPFAVQPWQRIALQAAFGSDPVRELLSATRLMHGDKPPTLFVEAAVCAA